MRNIKQGDRVRVKDDSLNLREYEVIDSREGKIKIKFAGAEVIADEKYFTLSRTKEKVEEDEADWIAFLEEQEEQEREAHYERLEAIYKHL